MHGVTSENAMIRTSPMFPNTAEAELSR